MGLQVYYVAVSIYGWYYWLRGGETNRKHEAPVVTAKRKLWLQLSAASIAIYGVILYILKKYTDSPVPYMDSLTTALSIVATWMLARKIVEHWLIWIFVDLVSAGLYIYKDLWPTTILFIVYTVMAIIGYFEWKNSIKVADAKRTS
jgi:nicotinamide mononucleotide transporter